MTHSSPPDFLDNRTIEFVRATLGVDAVEMLEKIQPLWGEQGQILRLRTDSSLYPSCVLKHISLNTQAHHPRGWHTSASFQRKATSYEVEQCWYERYAMSCDSACQVAQLLGTQKHNGGSLLLLEDLSPAYPRRCEELTVGESFVCLEWLAHFHARFLADPGTGLWPQGCYWHLSTREDEFDAMPEGALKQAAKTLDEKLVGAKFQTLIHGDAKVANFCFSQSLEAVAAVDFQYVGKGCGIRDVVYFLGSCLTDAECAENDAALLDTYFNALRGALSNTVSQSIIQELETEWRSLYGVAWTDFYRFLQGWMPAHAKINSYTLSLCEATLSDL